MKSDAVGSSSAMLCLALMPTRRKGGWPYKDLLICLLRHVGGFARRAAPNAEACRMTVKTQDYAVSDLGLADYGRKEISIAETEMPGLMATRAEFAATQPIKGESLKDYWDYTHRIFEWSDGGRPNMILDDGGDATALIHLGFRAEQGDTAFLEAAANEEEEV